MTEQLRELPTPPANLPECDVRYVALYLWKNEPMHWTTEHCTTLRQAEGNEEWAVPGTLRIFQVPEKREGGNG